MTLPDAGKSHRAVPLGLGPRGLLPNLYDVVIFILMAGIFVLLAHGAREMGASLTKLDVAPVTLDPTNLPEYALRTKSRPTPISRAVGCSLISRGFDAAAPVAVILAELLQTRIHYHYRCCVAMRSRAETRYRCL
jgi:hypothetical protein